MVELKGLLWKKFKKSEGKEEKPKEEAKPEEKKPEKPKEEKEEVKRVEKPKSEEELRKIDQLLRGKDEEIWRQEQAIKQKKLEIFKAYDELNTEKLRSMGFDKNQSIIRCVVCRQWKSYDKDKLSELIKKNDFDIIWKYVCNECRKKMKKKRVSVKYDPKKFIGSD